MTFIAGQITPTGLVVAPLSGTSDAGLLGILDYLQQQMNTIYGASADFTSNSPDGQVLNAFAQVVEDVLQLLVMVNAGFDPSQAFGVILAQRGAIVGIQIQNATYSTLTEQITVSGPCPLYGNDQTTNPVYTIQDELGNQWELVSTVAIAAAGTASYQFEAANQGAVLAAPNTVNQPVTVVLQVTEVNNSAAAVPGKAQETDAAFKLRILNSTALGSIGYLPGLIAALQNIAGVSYANAYENDTSSVIVAGPQTGQGPHSVWAVISPGTATPAQIAQVLYVKHNAGAGVYVDNGPGHTVQTYVIQDLEFTVSPANATAGAIYSNNGNTFAVIDTISSGTSLDMVGSVPTTSGTLSLVSGTGDPTIAFSAVVPTSNPFVAQWNEVIETPCFVKVLATSLDGVNAPQISVLAGNGLLPTNPQYLPGLGGKLTPNVGEGVNVNEVVTALNSLDPNSLITFPLLTSGGSGVSLLAISGYGPTAQVATVDQQLDISNLTTIVTMAISQVFDATNFPSIGTALQQLAVSGLNPYLLAINTVTQVPHGTAFDFQIFGGYFNGGSATAGFAQNQSGATVVAPTGMNPAVVIYTAGATLGYDVLVVEDSLGNKVSIPIQVT
jgi:hypothetical protein